MVSTTARSASISKSQTGQHAVTVQAARLIAPTVGQADRQSATL
jgi:hypothetical protein